MIMLFNATYVKTAKNKFQIRSVKHGFNIHQNITFYSNFSITLHIDSIAVKFYITPSYW